MWNIFLIETNFKKLPHPVTVMFKQKQSIKKFLSSSKFRSYKTYSFPVKNKNKESPKYCILSNLIRSKYTFNNNYMLVY